MDHEVIQKIEKLEQAIKHLEFLVNAMAYGSFSNWPFRQEIYRQHMNDQEDTAHGSD